MLVVARPCEKPEVLCLTCSCVSVSSFSSTKVTKCFTKGEILVMIREFITLRELALSIGTKSSQKITVKQGNFVNLIFVLHPRVLGGVEKVLAEKRHRLEKRCWLPPPPWRFSHHQNAQHMFWAVFSSQWSFFLVILIIVFLGEIKSISPKKFERGSERT